MFHRRPAALDQLPASAAVSLARLSGLEGLSRALLVGIAPLLAFEALGSKAAVSHVYLAASIFTMAITLNLSRLEQLLARRWVVTLGAGFIICAAMLLGTQTGLLFALGLGMRSAAASIFSVCISLYILDYIGKRDLTHSESRRIFYSGIAWLLGPATGLWLYNAGSHTIPFVLSALAALCMLGYFWYLRLGTNQVVRPALSHPPNPLGAVRRYLRQPRLRIAYGITLARSCFWVTLFVYGPIYVLDAGLPAWMAGALLSGVCGMMFASPIIRRLADRFGTRQIIVGGLSTSAISLFGLALLGDAAPIGLLFWITAAIGGVALDVTGNIPFLRSVRPRERSEMTMVFSTWREASELLTPGIAAAVLLVAPFWVHYAVIGLMHVVTALSATRLPRRL